MSITEACQHDGAIEYVIMADAMCCVKCGKVVNNGRRFTPPPPNFAQFFRQVAPLVEAEKVLTDWLERSNLVFSDGASGIGWGYNVLRADGINPRPGAEPFSTFAQCLEWMLNWVVTDEHARTMGTVIDEFTTELAGLGVDPDLCAQAIVNMAQKRVDNLNNAK